MEIKIEDVALSYALQIGVDNVMLEPLKCIADAVRYGMKIQKEEMMKEAIERTVKIDAGGYPYIDCDGIELYDYDKDIPLAKEGDKYKVILIKEG